MGKQHKQNEPGNDKEKLQQFIEDTEENLDRTTEFAREHGEALSQEERNRIEEKNRHRQESIENLQQEIDENN